MCDVQGLVAGGVVRGPVPFGLGLQFAFTVVEQWFVSIICVCDVDGQSVIASNYKGHSGCHIGAPVRKSIDRPGHSIAGVEFSAPGVIFCHERLPVAKDPIEYHIVDIHGGRFEDHNVGEVATHNI